MASLVKNSMSSSSLSSAIEPVRKTSGEKPAEATEIWNIHSPAPNNKFGIEARRGVWATISEKGASRRVVGGDMNYAKEQTIHKKSKSSSKTRTLAIAISSDDEGEAEGNAEGEGKSEAKAEGECKSEGKATTIKFESIQAGNAWADTQVDDTQLESEPF